MPPSADDYDDNGRDRRRRDDDDRHEQGRHQERNVRSAPPSKFDLRLNPPYQIDFANVAAGKTIAATKRRVRFRFGFSNRQALEEGRVGTDCRGEEHEVVVVISALSGKRQVYSDGHEVHFSFGSFSDSTFETSWTMKGGHLVKVRGHVALPLFETPGFRQFDLTIDGLSYFAMPKLFELGVKNAMGVGGGGSTPAPLRAIPRSVSPGGSNDRYDVDGDDNAAYGYGHRRSTPDRRSDDSRSSSLRKETPSPPAEEPSASAGVVDILSDMSMSSASSSDLLSSPTLAEPAPMLMDGSSLAATTSNDQFAPVEANPAAVSNSNNFATVSQSILSQYGPASTQAAATAPYGAPSNGVLALANESHTYYAPPPQQQAPYGYPPTQPPGYAPVTPSYGGAANAAPTQGPPPAYYNHPSGPAATAPYSYAPAAPPQQPYHATPNSSNNYYAPVSPEGSVRSVTTMEEGSIHGGFDPSPIKLSMQPLALEDVEDADALAHIVGVDAAASGPKRPLTDVEKAMASLVNLGDIKENKVTPEQRRAMQVQQAKQQAKKKSQPAPPTAPTWRMGTSATLGDLKATPKEEKAALASGPKKEIMRTHAFDPRAVHAGMMVVYGAESSLANGAIPAPQGFGAARPAAYAPHPYYPQQVPQQPPSYVSPVQTGY